MLELNFQTENLQKISDFIGIQTRIVGVEVKHAGHLTSTTVTRFGEILKIFGHLFRAKIVFNNIFNLFL